MVCCYANPFRPPFCPCRIIDLWRAWFGMAVLSELARDTDVSQSSSPGIHIGNHGPRPSFWAWSPPGDPLRACCYAILGILCGLIPSHSHSSASIPTLSEPFVSSYSCRPSLTLHSFFPFHTDISARYPHFTLKSWLFSPSTLIPPLVVQTLQY